MTRAEPALRRIAALMTCHNRRETTLRCLDALFAQRGLDQVALSVYLVDDGSTDGTAEAVRRSHPSTVVLQGDGELYWAGGMRLALAEAIKSDFDLYLWLNDDTFLFPRALRSMIDTLDELEREGAPVIVVGSQRDPVTGECTFGGRRKHSWKPIEFLLVEPADGPLSCDTINGNCVLLSRATVRRVGGFSEYLTHSLADWDYGLRARELGVQSWVAPGYVGECRKNDESGTWLDHRVPLWRRWQMLSGTKVFPRHEWMAFARRFEGARWPLAWIRWYYALLFPHGLRRLRMMFRSARE